MGTLVRKVALLLAGVLVGTIMLAGAAYAKTFVGGDARDIIVGTPKSDTIYGLGGGDELRGRGGDDQLYGGRASDILNGYTGDDYLVGGKGVDTLKGGPGDDVIEAADNNEDSWIQCGGGEDRVSADKEDPVPPDCEFVNGRRR
jgi:Ca2+-binding RTX toxin-like protein